MHKSEKREKKIKRELLNEEVRKEKFDKEKSNLFKPFLDNEQIDALKKINENDITILVGKAGSGKSLLACTAALKALINGEVDKIILTRSTTSKDELGFMPGDLSTKFQPYLIPCLENMYKMYPKPHIEAYLRNGSIDMIPLQYTRGITYDNAFVIIDEAQNLTIDQLKLCLSRIGEGSKICLTGDLDQVDFKKREMSGLPQILDFKINNMCVIELMNEHRKKIVIDILEEFKKLESN